MGHFKCLGLDELESEGAVSELAFHSEFSLLNWLMFQSTMAIVLKSQFWLLNWLMIAMVSLNPSDLECWLMNRMMSQLVMTMVSEWTKEEIRIKLGNPPE